MAVGDRRAAWWIADRAGEVAVDLQGCEGEAFEGCERRVAGAEVVQAEPDSELGEFGEVADDQVVSFGDEDPFGHFDPELWRG